MSVATSVNNRLEQQLLKLQISLAARVVEEELRIRSQNPEYHMDQNLLQDAKEHPSNSNMPPEDAENNQLGIFDRPLPCFGCGIGWFSLLLGFVFLFMWYYATILYFRNYYQRDPRERPGLAANAIAALIFTVAALVAVAVIVL
ncbi:hypothetical protein H5410_033298 [Solanum commersonii]|uniref:Uncharacterized protein n=1 Tax=Solanum commersonii TaxID=4109 RepID=A0A9J5YQD4_SOLCO|nr:hypothetical protein H5410_033298 [Solanum commersonii]